MSPDPPPVAGAPPRAGIQCPNCGARTPGLRVDQRRVRTKHLGVGFWTATVLTLGIWALVRGVFGRKQVVRSYRCPACRYEWTP